jgi:ribulose-5-phosphate 4-epimerase/fuculose-1-phosphate aldolase
MTGVNEFEQRAEELIEAGRTLYQLGMVPATSGNSSPTVASPSPSQAGTRAG